MPYTADISRANPACFRFLIDQSGSMAGAVASRRDGSESRVAGDAVVACSSPGSISVS